MDHEVVQKMTKIKTEITRLLNQLKIGLAAETIYNEFWHWYCDVVIEDYKKEVISQETLETCFEAMLKCLHPFTPFVTEALWQELFPEKGMLMITKW